MSYTKDPHQAERINRMREGLLTEQDLQEFDARVCPPPPLDTAALLAWQADGTPEQHAQWLQVAANTPRWIVNTKKKREAYNQEMFAALPNEAITVHAFDVVVTHGTEGGKQRLLHQARTLAPDKCQNLCPRLDLKLGMFVKLTVNTDVPDGMCNGADGILRAITYPAATAGTAEESPAGMPPQILWVQFTSPRVGVKLRQQYAGAAAALGMSPDVVPIFPVTRTFCMGLSSALELQRTMFPLMPSRASTVHGIQGVSRLHVAVDTEGWKTAGMEYVALSRCTDAGVPLPVPESSHLTQASSQHQREVGDVPYAHRSAAAAVRAAPHLASACRGCLCSHAQLQQLASPPR